MCYRQAQGTALTGALQQAQYSSTVGVSAMSEYSWQTALILPLSFSATIWDRTNGSIIHTSTLFFLISDFRPAVTSFTQMCQPLLPALMSQ
jgi:hypothetical protein